MKMTSMKMKMEILFMGWTCWTVVEEQTESNLSTKTSSLNRVVGQWGRKCLRTYLQKSGIVTTIEFRRSAVMDFQRLDTTTWEVDELQLLVYKNRGFFLFPNWSNSSEYVATDESFDVVALQSKDDHDALQERV